MDDLPTIHRNIEITDMDTRPDRREIVAYAAVFDRTAEIRDQHGHYHEVIARSAFDQTLARTGDRLDRVKVLFNHGKDLSGRPSDRFSLPIGVPTQITADAQGLMTVTRVSKTPLGDEVLELARDGAVTGYSFTGKAFKSDPPQRSDDPGTLPTIRRTEIGLVEYGPGVFPSYDGAQVLAVRTADDIAGAITSLDPDERADLIRAIEGADPDSIADHALGLDDGTPDSPTTRSANGLTESTLRRYGAKVRLHGAPT